MKARSLILALCCAAGVMLLPGCEDEDPADYPEAVVRSITSAQKKKVEADLKTMEMSLGIHYSNTQQLPAEANWQEQLKDSGLEEEMTDPWDHPYYYKRTDEGAIIGSPGPDGSRGTDDDIVRAFNP
ncbi:MAG: type II secretion system protein GspG [Phycisphaerae bacterium]